MKVGVLSSKENVEHPHSQWGYQKRNPGDVRKLGYYPSGRAFNASCEVWGLSEEKATCRMKVGVLSSKENVEHPHSQGEARHS